MVYVRTDSFVQKMSRLLSKVDYRRAVSDDDRDAIFKLRYEAYMREKTIEPNDSERFFDSYDDSSNCWIFGVYYEDELAASIRVHKADKYRMDCPSLKTFYDIINPALSRGNVIVDPTRFVIDRRVARKVSGLPYMTLRLCWMAAEHFRANNFLVAIRPEHQAFYKRTFHHKPICPARSYALLHCPISLMSVSYEDAFDWVYERYPFFRSNKFERRMLFGDETGLSTAPLTPELAAANIPPVWPNGAYVPAPGDAGQ